MDYTKDYLKQKRNKNLKGIFIGIGILLVALFGSTYAFFTYSKSLQAFTLTSSGVTAKFTSGSNEINISNAYPISDEFAISNLDKLSYIDFTVEGNIQDEDQGLTYEIYLTEKSGNTLDPNYIKVYITDENGEQVKSPKIYNSLENTTYSKDSSTGKLIYKLEGIPGNYSKNFRIYAWIDKDYSQNEVSQEFSFYVNLYAYNSENRDGAYLIKKAALARANDGSNCLTTVEEDGITYISGSKTCIDFNYVWWSGYMWRITAIYPDGSMKMITDNNITSIAFNSSGNVTYYNKDTEAKSYMFQWLNEDFLDTLYNHGADVIDTTKYWNTATMGIISTKLEDTEATMIPTTISPIGLLNSYEYYKSYQNTTYGSGYLNIGYEWWLLNSYSASNVWVVGDAGGGIKNRSPHEANDVRPSIIIKSGITPVGSGTKSSPYKISTDYSEANENDKVYIRHSGEYIKFDTDASAGNYDNAPLYRIVGVEGEGNTRITKIVAMDYAANKTTKKFASTVTFGASGNTKSNDYWDYYLNNDWYDNLSFKEKLTSGNYYLGLGTTEYNYKKSICSTDTTDRVSSCTKQTSYPFMVGLLRYGEMFATQQGTGYSNSTHMWLITKYNASYVWFVGSFGGNGQTRPTNAYGVRPTYYLKSDIKILSGNGTENNPYIVS